MGFPATITANTTPHSQRLNPADVLSTALCLVASNIDFATRAAKILARRTKKPVYLGCSVSFAGATVEEEIEGVQAVIEAVMKEVGKEGMKGMRNGI